jgi:hypothetical protein
MTGHTTFADGFKDAHRAKTRHVTCVLRHVEADTHMRLCRHVIDLVRLQIEDQRHQVAGIDEVAVMEEQADIFPVVRIAVEMVDAPGVESA